MVLPEWNGRPLPCRWTACTKVLSTPELLYEHISQRHVGWKRKHTLNTTCAWDNCGKTPKRWLYRSDMKSHMCVHVPLRPFKCELCGHMAKRVQDLNTHLKTCPAKDSIVINPTPHILKPGGLRKNSLKTTGSSCRSTDPRPPAAGPSQTGGRGHANGPYSLVHMRNSIMQMGRRMRDPRYNLTDQQGIKIVLKTLKKCRVPGAHALRRRLKQLRADGNLTWKRLLEELD